MIPTIHTAAKTVGVAAIDFSALDDGRVKLAYAQRKVLRETYGDRRNNLLSVMERQRHAAIGSQEYANAWHSGRILAKALLLAAQRTRWMAPDRITIHSRNHRGEGTRPRVWYGERELQLSLSLSHAPEAVLVGLATAKQTRVGVDVVSIGSVKESVQKMWFLPNERRLARDDSVASQIWAAKEAVYKALNEGEPFYPRRIIIEDRDATSCSCRYQSPTGLRRLVARTWHSRDGHMSACAVARIQDPV